MLHWPGGSSLLIGLCSNLDPAHVGGLSFPRCGNLAVSLGCAEKPRRSQRGTWKDWNRGNHQRSIKFAMNIHWKKGYLTWWRPSNKMTLWMKHIDEVWKQFLKITRGSAVLLQVARDCVFHDSMEKNQAIPNVYMFLKLRPANPSKTSWNPMESQILNMCWHDSVSICLVVHLCLGECFARFDDNLLLAGMTLDFIQITRWKVGGPHWSQEL